MANVREKAKKERLTKLGSIVQKLREKNEEINTDQLVAKMIVEHGISKKTALEEIEAVMLYDFVNGK